MRIKRWESGLLLAALALFLYAPAAEAAEVRCGTIELVQLLLGWLGV